MVDFYLSIFRKYPLWTILGSILAFVAAEKVVSPFGTLFFVFIEFKYHLGIGHFVSYIIFGIFIGMILGAFSAWRKLNIGLVPFIIPLLFSLFLLITLFLFHSMNVLAAGHNDKYIDSVSSSPEPTIFENSPTQETSIPDFKADSNYNIDSIENANVPLVSDVEPTDTNQEEENSKIIDSNFPLDSDLLTFNDQVARFIDDVNSHDVEKVKDWFAPVVERYFLRSNLTRDELAQIIKSYWLKNKDEVLIDSFQRPQIVDDKVITIFHGVCKKNYQVNKIRQEIHFDQNGKIIFVRAFNAR